MMTEDECEAANYNGVDLGAAWDDPDFMGPQLSPPGAPATPEAAAEFFAMWGITAADFAASPGPDTPTGAPVMPGGWPAAVPIRPANWHPANRDYKLSPGDTLAGLAATYLGSPQRWNEIWNEQSDGFRATRKPDQLGAGEWIKMPLQAVATLMAATGRTPPPGTTPAPAPPGGYVVPGRDAPPGSAVTPAASKKEGNTILVLAGAAALVAAVVVFGKGKSE